MSQQQLFSLPAAYAISVKLEPNGTWSVMIAKNHLGETWDVRMRETYTDLSLSESIDVIAGVLFTG